jgi:hypothetical protein
MQTMKKLLLIALVLLPTLTFAYPKGSHKSDYSGGYSGGYSSHSTCYACSHRSSSERSAFIRSNPKPGYGRYIVDHIVPLKRGGADSRYNMQWQTYDAAKAKDKWE